MMGSGMESLFGFRSALTDHEGFASIAAMSSGVLAIVE